MKQGCRLAPLRKTLHGTVRESKVDAEGGEATALGRFAEFIDPGNASRDLVARFMSSQYSSCSRLNRSIFIRPMLSGRSLRKWPMAEKQRRRARVYQHDHGIEHFHACDSRRGIACIRVNTVI